MAGDGRTPDAIQLLANQASARRSEDAPRIVIDVEGNHERREAFLTRVAERAAGRARETGRTVALDPMGPRDRRSIHVALREAEANGSPSPVTEPDAGVARWGVLLSGGNVDQSLLTRAIASCAS